VGNSTSDDAAVYRINSECALVQSVDVFTPIVDDPYTFGLIAAANALSDIYAMGARPIVALSIIGFPVGKLPVSDMTLIMKGGIDKAREAGIEVAGGHSIEDSEPKYGLCVTGLVHPERIYRNSTARAGDVLFLTKPLGSGVIAQAIKKGCADAEEVAEAVAVMGELNKKASEAMVAVNASACTDITGFGLLGHLVEMLKGSEHAAELTFSQVPILKGVTRHIQAGVFPGGTRKILDFCQSHLQWGEDLPAEAAFILADPQTSGGLLIAMSEPRKEELRTVFADQGVETYAEIGRVVEGPAGHVKISN